MSVVEAVIILAGVIKQIADDASANSTLSASLTARVEIIPRILMKFPNHADLDEQLLNRMYGFLKEAHDLLLAYKSKGVMSRMFSASSMRSKFAAVEVNIGRCVDDLSFNVGITSAAVLESIRADIRNERKDDLEADEAAQDAVTATVEEEEGMDLAGFDEMASQIENQSSALKVFGSAECFQTTAVFNSATSNAQAESTVRVPATSIVVYGDKIIVQNLQKPQTGGAKAPRAVEYEEECVHSSGILAAPVVPSGGTVGTVVFHIDNTSSMLRDKRMQLTKEVLSKVIPNFLRMGYRVVVNSWASTQENKGKMDTREVRLNGALMDALQGCCSSATKSDGSAVAGGAPAATGDAGEAQPAEFDRALQQYLDDKIFDILVPKGRTDLYGSCFQLLRQCQSFLQGDSVGPVHAFVLTDGEHNILDFPVHQPRYEGEEYFGVYTASAVPNKAGNAANSANSKRKLKFSRSGVEPSVPGCEKFLRSELDVLNGKKADRGDDMANSNGGKATTAAQENAPFSLTFIGIGDAETKALSSLTEVLGQDQCAFYGITKVSQSDVVFQNISAGNSDIKVLGDKLSGTGVALKYTYEEEGVGGVVTHGAAATIADHFAVQALHASASLQLQMPQRGNAAGTISLAALEDSTAGKSLLGYGKTDRVELHRKVDEFISEIRRIRPTAYEVDAQSFGTVFRQLVADKKVLHQLKASFLSKHTRRLRLYSLFSGLGVWLKELEELIESQIASYRMNVEGEILANIAQQRPTEGNSGTTSGDYLKPTQMVLARLQNNLSNAGRNTHRVLRHVAAISSIRDRTLHIAGALFSTQLSLHYLRYITSGPENTSGDNGGDVYGLSLKVERHTGETGAGKTFCVHWKAAVNEENSAPLSDETREARVQQIYDACLEVTEPFSVDANNNSVCVADEQVNNRYAYLLSGLTNSLSKRASISSTEVDSAVVFPCILLSAKFDQFAIVRATYVFFTGDVYCHAESNGSLKVKVFCAQEIWELCHSSNHIVGEALPLGFDSNNHKAAPNMVLPLAHTPLLFALYVERGRAYHSAINVTGDCMALTVVSLQWAKVFHDALMLTLCSSKGEAGSTLDTTGSALAMAQLRVLVQESLKAVVALHYSIESTVMLPSKAGLNKLFAFSPTTDEAGAHYPELTDCSQAVITREDCSGLTCAIAIAALVAGGELPYANLSNSWNILLRTLFCRLAEAISGTKNIRVSITTGASDGVLASNKDPSALEHEYRLKLGELQGLLRKRLHVEWVKCSAEAKRVQVRANAESILACLREIVSQFLSRLDEFGVQSWAQAAGLVQQALLLKKYGILRLRSEFVDFTDLTALETRLIAAGLMFQQSPFLVPICETNTHGELHIREATVEDVDHIVLYVDALVATKAAPKLEYKPVLNPSYPTFSTADNRAAGVKFNCVEWDEQLPSANIAFIGNVNSGKSSISGMVLSYLQIVPEEVVTRLGKEAKKLGLPEELKHAWVMDTTSHERSGGFTIKPTWAGFQTPTRRYTIIDNPGHKDFCRNAAFGVFEADSVVLVMPVTILDPASDAAGGDGRLSTQAEEHLITAFCFGVRELVVAVNKMDLVNYSQESFEAVRAYTLKIMKKAGFKPESAVFVPVSVLQGEGFLSASPKMSSWYTGPCLLQACDELPLAKRVVDKPLRMVVDEVFHSAKTPHGYTAVLCGKVERGALSLQDNVALYPSGPQRAKVLSLQLHGTTVSDAKAGDNVGVRIEYKRNGGPAPDSAQAGKAGKITKTSAVVVNEECREVQKPCKGMILTLCSQPAVSVVTRFEAQLLIVHGTAFKVGYKPSLTTHLVTVSVHITRLIEIIGRNNTVLESNPTEVKVGQTVVCEMTSLRPFAAETIHDMPRLSRFLIKEERSIAAIGFIRRIIS